MRKQCHVPESSSPVSCHCAWFGKYYSSLKIVECPGIQEEGTRKKGEFFFKNRRSRKGYDKHKPFVPNKINEKKLEAHR